MKNYISTVSKIVIVLFLVAIFSFIFSSCSTVKKNQEVEKTEIKQDHNVDSISLKKAETNLETKKNVAEENEVEEIEMEIVVENGDSLEIINYDASGKKTSSKKYKGAGKIKSKKSKSKYKSIQKIKEKSKTKHNLLIKVNKRTHARYANKKAILTKEKKFSFFNNYWFWILVLIAIVLWYLNKRFKLFFWLSNIFSKFFGM